MSAGSSTPLCQNCKMMKTCEENINYYELKKIPKTKLPFYCALHKCNFKIVPKLVQLHWLKILYILKENVSRFVVESILRNQRLTFLKTIVKSQARSCVENAEDRRSRICDSIPCKVSVHTRWHERRHLVERTPCHRLWPSVSVVGMQSLSFVSGFHKTLSPPATTS